MLDVSLGIPYEPRSETVINGHKRRLRRVSTAIAVVALAVAAMGASAAQAAIWHLNEKPLTGELGLTNYPGVGTLEMKLSSPNPVHIICQAPSVHGGPTSKIWAETHFETNTFISGCKTYLNSNGEHVKGCDQTNEVQIHLIGTGAKVATNTELAGGKIVFGEECPVGYSLAPVIETMALEWPSDPWHPAEGIEHEVKGSGSGYLGTVKKPMTVTYSNNFQRYIPEGQIWGWF